jgi:hypothetical protein
LRHGTHQAQLDEQVWTELRTMAEEQHQDVPSLLTEAIPEYPKRRRVCPVVMKKLEGASDENRWLGERLAG